MAVKNGDKIKVSVLIGLLGICLLSAIQKFAFYPDITIEISPDFFPCTEYRKIYNSSANCDDSQCLFVKAQYEHCKDIIVTSYKKISRVCSGYNSQYLQCVSRNPLQCEIEQSNVVGCTKSILLPPLNEWIVLVTNKTL